MILRPLPTVLFLLAIAGANQPLRAQDVAASDEVPLEVFVQEVVRLWLSGDVAALVELIPEADQLILDTGTGIENANSRHAAAALRALFSESETLATRAVRVTVASTSPPKGFGELSWTFRSRGSPGEQSRSIYVAAARENASWKITELRLMP
jgi:hypothetical protein